MSMFDQADAETIADADDPRAASRVAPSPSRSERTLIKAAQKGDAPAAGELVRLHWPDTHRLAFLILRDTHLAEDVAQESLLKAIGSLGRFDRRRSMAPWLRRIVSNKCLDRLRSDQARRDREEAADPFLAPAIPAGVEDPELLGALWKLALPDRTAVVLRHVFDFPIGEIAEILGEPLSTVRSRVHRSLVRLRGELEAREES
jgi:RNA polymerase sigma-70 factor (ECF subfamily)